MTLIEGLREKFSYDPDTGRLYNRKTGRRLGYEKKTGYWWVGFRQKQLRFHRVVWMIVHGHEPDQIDHINGDRSDNRICNLRNVGRRENSKNMRRYPNNKSGCSGVNLHAKSKRWIAQIRDDGRYVYLGSFVDLESAIQARKDAEAKYGYHQNHGSVRKRYERD